MPQKNVPLSLVRLRACRPFLAGMLGLGLISGPAAGQVVGGVVGEVLGQAAQAGPTAGPTAADVEARLRDELAKTWAPGCALAVVKEGRLVYSGAVGLANIEHRAAMMTSTVFEIGSVTKQFTAVVALMLADEGKLSLDDPLSKWLEGIPEEWKPATIRQLLSHQSGIPAYTASREFREGACCALSREALLGHASSQPMRFSPGAKYGYSNTNHLLVGYVIEKVAGKPFCDVLAERITTPLGMTATRCSDELKIIPNRAGGYTGRDMDDVRHAEPVVVGPFGGSAGLESTVEDMVKWDARLQSGTLLRPERVRQLGVPMTLADGSPTNAGLGWMVETSGAHRVLVQSGGHPGVNAAMIRLPDDDMFAVVMVNTDMASAGFLAKRVLALWIPSLFDVVQPSTDPDPALTARLRAFLLALPTQGYDRAQLAPDVAERLAGEPLQQAGAFLGGLGSLQSLEMLDRRPLAGGLSQVRYKATYEKLPLEATFVFTGDEKIAGVNFAPL